MKKINESNNIRYGVLLSYLSLAVSIFGALLVTSRMLNLIGDYNYGLYSFVNSITTWLTVVSSALTASYLRFATLEAHDHSGNTKITNTIYLKILLIIGIVILFFGLISIGFLYYMQVRIGKYNWEDSKLMYLLFALSIINIGISIPSSIYSLYVNYKKSFIFAKGLSIIITIITYIGNLTIAYYTRNIVTVSIFIIATTLITLIANRSFSKNRLNISFAKTNLRDNRVLVKSIVAFSVILLFNSIVDQINSNVDKTLLGIFSCPEDITVYQMGYQLSAYLTMMSIAVSGVFAPSFHELVAKNDRKTINNLYLKISGIQSFIICFIAFGFLTAGKDFILWWIGPTRVNSYYIATGLMIVNICPLTLNSSIEIQRADNKHLFRAINYFVLAIANILLSIVFLNSFDDRYAVIACLLGTVITKICSHWIAMNIYNAKVIMLPIKKYMFVLFKFTLFGIIAFGIERMLEFMLFDSLKNYLIRFILQGAIYTISYSLFVLVFERQYLYSIIRKIKS